MKNQPQTRREFLRAATRAVLLGATGLVGVALLRRRDCATRGGCGGCNIAENCTLPWKEAKR
jgi:hypothetical protein